ncbi:MAG TPA: uL22 family ribosomal protein [Candidatus Nanoarchaeia archaeon]|nr:uL22 family ribosomal protein [Candidatus Nanoarchaeia archaeon]
MTEKNYNPEQRTMKKVGIIGKKKKEKAPKKQKAEIKEIKQPEQEIKKQSEMNVETKALEKTEQPKEEKKKETPKPVIKKSEATVNATSLPISTKVSSAICKFIKGKTIEDAIKDLELVIKKKKVLPMTGEIPHRKGKGIMSGGYPQNASKEFIILLKGLAGNANVNGIEEPVIVEAVPNMAARPMGSFGRVRRKRTHVKLVAKEKMEIKKNG